MSEKYVSWMFALMWTALVIMCISTLLMKERIKSLQTVTEAQSKIILQQQEVNKSQTELNEAQQYFNSYIYQTVIEKRGKAL